MKTARKLDMQNLTEKLLSKEVEYDFKTTRKKYKDEVVNYLLEKFGYKNIMEVPKLEKVVINIGLGEAKR